MIPDFDENGNLPPGVHGATLEEIEERFGKESELRHAQMQSIRWLIEMARNGGVQKVIFNGSFVTDQPEPNDVDCVLLLDPDSIRDQEAVRSLLNGLPFIELYLVGPKDYNYFANEFFATDREQFPKGIIEVVL